MCFLLSLCVLVTEITVIEQLFPFYIYDSPSLAKMCPDIFSRTALSEQNSFQGVHEALREGTDSVKVNGGYCVHYPQGFIATH